MTLDKAFQPESYESRIAEKWEHAGLFRAGEAATTKRFSLVIPPPNVTGALHIGHAFDMTLQDIVVRWNRMLGHDTLWVPGTDHAGIATQMVVEKRLREQGTSRHELGRERFEQQVWKWKDIYRQRIVDSLRRLGCSCDWSRERFTLDPGLSRAVRETFVRLYDEGLIYRGTRLINWCPDCRTALSDLEVDRDKPEQGEMWSFAYPIEGGGEIVVATTRPETMLGDTAIAVHPEDERYRAMIGRRVLHPFFPERDVRVVGDAELADPETGTGAVKVTPAHDPNDFACGLRHGLEQISIFEPDGAVNAAGGPFRGLNRFEARKRVKQALEERGLARGTQAHTLTPGRCQRCRTIVEPTISTQWFLKMEPLAGPALEAVRDGRIRFVPSSWEKTFFHWLENIQDWCISRQLWWGHRIPAWYCGACGEVIVSREPPQRCTSCASGELEQDPDVLDTWFSSQLWPFSVFGWPDKTDELARYYPTDVLVTGFDIIFFWVARMIMAGLKMTGEVPFRTVLFHGMVRDAAGQKMSKTAGNAVEPELLLAEHGADATRFTLAALASSGTDLALSEQRLTGYRAFMNKLWNATRFLLLRLPADDGRQRVTYEADELDDLDRYLIARYLETVEGVDRAYHEFRFDQAAELLYHFLWHTYCDWSIELSKPDLADRADGTDPRRADVRRSVLLDVLDGALRLLHPIAPFITEELWQHLPQRSHAEPFLAASSIPTAERQPLPLPILDDRTELIASFDDWLIGPVNAARGLRAAAGVEPARKVTLRLRPRQPGGARMLERYRDRIEILVRAEQVIIDEGPVPDEPALRQVLETVEVVLPLSGAVDLAKERERLLKEKGKLDRELAASERKLANAKFVSRAPAEVVAKERERLAAGRGRLEEIERLLAQLGTG
ncbi:MAG: valine--tRNA ligase [Acidobacteriota bacterium]|nr:MAG: valine--tRNA ligase [Acidobacteriota bacterium]